jgi:hypothetical protein
MGVGNIKSRQGTLMAGKKKVNSFKKQPLGSGQILTKHNILRALGVVLVLAIVGWIAMNQVQRQIAIHHQQQRFDKIRRLQQNFQANVRQSLGSSLISINENDSCYREDQSDLGAFRPFHNGILFCGIRVSGYTKELPNAISSGHGATSTRSVLAGIARDVISHSDVDYRQGYHSITAPEPENSVGVDDRYDLYQKNVRCDLSVVTLNVRGTDGALRVKAGDLEFHLNCEQPASKYFFRYVPSALD